MSTEGFSAENKQCGALRFEIVGLDNSAFKIKNDEDTGVSIASKPTSMGHVGIKTFTVKACQGKHVPCVESSPITMEVLNSCKYNEILPFTVPDIDAIFDHQSELVIEGAPFRDQVSSSLGRLTDWLAAEAAAICSSYPAEFPQASFISSLYSLYIKKKKVIILL